jgi:lipoprotein-anchoring transpeptidase ErfK/SrfK
MIMRTLMLACALFILSFFPALAGTVTAIVDKTDQTMIVLVDNQPVYQWAVSTGKYYDWTPPGTFGVQSMKTMHYSTKYSNAPMPHSIFFNGDIAAHGTTEIDQLGKMASKGCVRLHPDNAKILFDLVRAHGQDNATFIVQD